MCFRTLLGRKLGSNRGEIIGLYEIYLFIWSIFNGRCISQYIMSNARMDWRGFGRKR
jgi:hypothetical protein